jgi:hypothetical protein
MYRKSGSAASPPAINGWLLYTRRDLPAHSLYLGSKSYSQMDESREIILNFFNHLPMG